MKGTDGFLRFGNFEVLTKPEGGPFVLGGGSFGKTYKARHLFLDQIVALKVINDQSLQDASAKARFLREAKVVHQLRHPNIAHVVDFGETNGSLYYAMEYCDGGSLEDFVNQHGPVPPRTVLYFGRQIAAALSCAHGRGFIHRDIKPSNVMLTGQGDPPQLKLIDFGLVKRLQGAGESMPALTLAGHSIFTPLFASPEQLQEEELDGRSDLFSLGITMLFLLKGEAPEHGATATIVARRLIRESYETDLPHALCGEAHPILSRLLKKAREERFQSADELVAAIDLVLSDPASGAEFDVDPERTTIPIESTDAGVLTAQPPAEPPVGEAEPNPEATAIGMEEMAAGAATSGVEPEVQPEVQPDAEPARTLPRSLFTDYEFPIEKIKRIAAGTAYRAIRKTDGAMRALVLVDDNFREDPNRMDPLIRAVERFGRDASASGGLVLEEYEEGIVLIGDYAAPATPGIDLHTLLKARGWIPYAEALAVLRPIAEVIDCMMAAQFSSIEPALDRIILQPADGSPPFADPSRLLTLPLHRWPAFRVRLPPVSLDEEGAQDAGGTMDNFTSGNPRVEFSCLVYHLVAGRRVPNSARIDRGWVATANFGENGNAILKACIANDFSGEGCASVLEALDQSEGAGSSAAGFPLPMVSFKSSLPAPSRNRAAAAAPPPPARASAPPPPLPPAYQPDAAAAVTARERWVAPPPPVRPPPVYAATQGPVIPPPHSVVPVAPVGISRGPEPPRAPWPPTSPPPIHAVPAPQGGSRSLIVLAILLFIVAAACAGGAAWYFTKASETGDATPPASQNR